MWYGVTAPESGYFDIAVTIPADVSFYYGVFDSVGAAIVPVGSDIGGPGPDIIHGQGTPDEVYYIGLVTGAYGMSGDIDVTVNWTEMTPTYLSDANVPDAELRALLEEYVPGKVFEIVGSTPPDQANWITDLDLAALGSLRTDGWDGQSVYTGITNLTGLEYCTGVGFLLLNENDLSTTDFSVLQNLTNLYALDLWNCNLQNLSLIDYLVNPDFHHLKVFGNPALTLADITSVTAADFPGMRRLAFGAFDATGDGVADEVSSADWSTLVSFLATHTNLEELTLNSGMNFTDAMFAELVTGVIAPKASDWLWLDFGNNANLADISPLTGLSILYCLQLYSTAVSDLTPVWDLYNIDGAFTDPDRNNYINITGCNMELWPGSPNRTIVDDLIAAGVDVYYEAGNILVDIIPLSDAEVPDEGLRTVLEQCVGGGKEFATTINPEPAIQITTADLAALTELSYSTPVTVNELTGLEYCDSVDSINFYNMDLGGCDQSSGGFSAAALEGMDNLAWLKLDNCNLSALDFLSGLNELEALTTKYNPKLDIDDFSAVLTPANFPQLQYIYLTGWDLDGDDDLDASDVFSGADWHGVLDLMRPFTDLRSLELSWFYQGDTEFAKLFDPGEVLDNNSDCLTSFFTRNSGITDGTVGLISDLTALGHLVVSGNPGITDLSSLSGMGTLEYVGANDTSITDLTPFQDMYDDGAFRNHFSYATHDIDVSYCGLDITPSSANRSIVDNLISNDVRVEYRDGNQVYTQVLTWTNAFANPNGAYIHGMTYDGTDLWMVGRDTHSIYRVDASNGSVLATIPTPTTATDGTGLTYDGTSLWYTHDQSPKMIHKVNPADGTVLSSFTAPSGGDSTGLAWDGTYLWNTGFGENIYQLDTEGNVQTSFAAPTSTPEGMTYANGYLWAVGYSNTLYKLDPADGTIVASYSTPSANLYGLASDGTYLWLSTSDGSIKKHLLSGL